MMTMIIIATSFIGVACLVGGVASVMLRGSSASAVEDRLDILTGAVQAPGKAKSADTNVLSMPLDDMPSFAEILFSRVINLRVFLQQADSQLSPTKFLVISGAMAAVGALAIVFARAPAYLAPLGVCAGILPFMYLYFKRKSRMSKF